MGQGWNLPFLGQEDPNYSSCTNSNPDGDVQPWCYVAETEEGIYWRYCDIPTCHSEWAGLDKGGSRAAWAEFAFGGASLSLTLLPPQCLGTWAASWTPGHPRPSAAPAAPQQSSRSRCAFASAA